MSIYAGYWGPEALFWSTSGTPVRSTEVTVRDPLTMLPTTLYTDKTKSTTLPNPTLTDEHGNLAFYATPGSYLLDWGATDDLFIVVSTHPDDPSGGGGGVTDHGLLTGLADDDHTQYLTTVRGDARYYTEGEVDASLAGKAATVHTHTASQVTDFGTAVDAQVAGALAGKQPLDSDLTAIAALTPADGSVLVRVSGAWNSRTSAQLKSDLALTKADVGLGNVDNTADASKPISTATQTALDAKAPRAYVTDPITKYGLVTATGRFEAFQDIGTYTNQMKIERLFVPANSGALTRATIPVRNASTGFTPNGKPNHLLWWTDNGVLTGQTPDNSAMWNTADWSIGTFDVPVPNSTTDQYVYVGFQINGQTGVGQFTVTRAFDAGTVPFAHAAGSSKRFSAYGASVVTPTDINPTTFGTITSFAIFLGLMA